MACRDPRQPGLRGLSLSEVDLQRQLPDLQERAWQQRGYSLQAARRRLLPGHCLKETTLRKWIAAGMLRARRQRRNWRIPAQELARFQATWCLAADICAHLGISRTTLSRWEAAGCIQAVYRRRTHAGAGASLYRRTDLHQLHRHRRPARRKEEPCS